MGKGFGPTAWAVVTDAGRVVDVVIPSGDPVVDLATAWGIVGDLDAMRRAEVTYVTDLARVGVAERARFYGAGRVSGRRVAGRVA